MKVIGMIIQMAKENNGVVTAAMVSKSGISRGNLKYLVDNGKLEKSGRGVYTLPDVWDDELFSLQNGLSEVSIPVKQHCFYGIYQTELQIVIL